MYAIFDEISLTVLTIKMDCATIANRISNKVRE